MLALTFAVIASLRIAATYTVFSHTIDEPGHIACGMEWLDKGIYTWEPQHPPLARIAVALGPFLSGIRSQGVPHGEEIQRSKEGVKILYHQNHYDRTLSLARLGILPFFWIACFTLYLWGLRDFSRVVACMAVFLFTLLPPVLAHTGMATTDLAVTAFLALAFFTGIAWADQPTIGRAAFFGAAVGLMVLSKFSCLVFFPVTVALAMAGYSIVERPGASAALKALRERAPTFALAVLTGSLLIWAGYRFSFGTPWAGAPPLPFPELFQGIRQLQEHASGGHTAYLMGQTSFYGFWNYYLVALGVKSPLAFLALLAIGLVWVFRQDPLTRRLWLPLVFSIGTLLPAMFSTINIGVRHVLPVYVGFSLLAAVAVVKLIQEGEIARWKWALAGALVLWMAASSVLSHPDYLAYFNELAGNEPEKILVDSDLDWGQDIKRLTDRLHKLGVTDIAYTTSVWDDLDARGFPRIHPLLKYQPVEGWNAIGVHLWKAMHTVVWPDYIPPRERVGRSILLWYFPPTGRKR